jgi:quercetin dioxygenase-like cupin family protein
LQGNSRPRRTHLASAAKFFLACSAFGLAGGCAASHSSGDHNETAADTSRPLILRDSEGERRLHRPPPGSMSNLAAPFIMKVDRRNGGSPELVMFTEDIPPGQAIPPHRHPHADEIIFIHGGSGVAMLGDRETTVAAGTTIYMPRNTSVRLKNTGTEPLRIVALFSKPGYDEYMREISVAEGDAAKPLTVEELTAIRARHAAHVLYEKP